MPTLTIEYRDESHRIALEQAIAYVTQLRRRPNQHRLGDSP